MSLGLCCQWVEPQQKRNGDVVYPNIIGENSLQLGRFRSGAYSREKIVSTYHNNVDQHIRIVRKLIANNIKSFRLTSGMLPLWEFNRDLVDGDVVLLSKFQQLGKLFLDNNIRVTCHPGQFTIINSNEERVIQNAIRELEYHAWMFDAMNLPVSPYYAINIHGGKRHNSEKLIASINNRLPLNVKGRLTLENDERCFSVPQLLEVSKRTGVPVVFDSHHFVFNMDGLSMSEAFRECCKTWERIGVKPLQHLSNTESGLEGGSFTERRKHSWGIHYIPEEQLGAARGDTVDIDVEAKGKNIALLKLRSQFNIPV